MDLFYLKQKHQTSQVRPLKVRPLHLHGMVAMRLQLLRRHRILLMPSMWARWSISSSYAPKPTNPGADTDTEDVNDEILIKDVQGPGS